MVEIVGRYVEVGGIHAYYESCGAGTPVLLLHTAGRDSRQWHGVMAALGSSFQLVAPDLPGHGKSWPVSGNRCFEDITEIAQWLKLLMARVVGGRFAVMGCSLGGNLALLMPALFDEIVASIVLQGADFTPSMTESALDLLTHPKISVMHAVMDTTMSLMGSRSSETARELAQWGALSVIPLALQGDLRAYIRTDIRHLMNRIKVPMLLAHGNEDWIVPEERVRETCTRITASPQCEFVSLPGLGHFPHLEQPSRIAELARRFLAEGG